MIITLKATSSRRLLSDNTNQDDSDNCCGCDCGLWRSNKKKMKLKSDKSPTKKPSARFITFGSDFDMESSLPSDINAPFGEYTDSLVIRKEIREMSIQEQRRFINAIKQMMKNKDDVGTSTYYELAKIHSNINDSYCHYGRESFVGWIRLYLREFEKLLSISDRKLGNDGIISLPYWDWIRPVINDQIIPQIFLDTFNKFPNDLFPSNQDKIPIIERRHQQINIDKGYYFQNVLNGIIKQYDFKDAVDQCLKTNTYKQFVQKLEEITVDFNGLIGYPLNNMNFASFDPLFWSHYANIDRIYSSYLRSQNIEFLKNDMRLSSNKQILLNPFTHKNGEICNLKDVFNTEQIGYIYDSLINPLPEINDIFKPRSFVVFPNINISDYDSSCYELHVFVMTNKEIIEWDESVQLNKIQQLINNSSHYAGSTKIFGLKCKSCYDDKIVFDLSVDVTQTLKKKKLDQWNAVIRVLAVEISQTKQGPIKELIHIAGIPQPVLRAPIMINHINSSSSRSNNTHYDQIIPNHETVILQSILHKYGYYNGDIDGKFGLKTEDSVKRYQSATGSLLSDGIVGRLTKQFMMKPRYANKDFEDDVVKRIRELNGNKINFTYFVDNLPHTLLLNEDQVYEEIQMAFGVWSKVNLNDGDDKDTKQKKLKFALTEKRDNADILIKWTDQTQKNIFRYDGVEGMVGYVDIGGNNGTQIMINLDKNEKWVLKLLDDDDYFGDNKRKRKISLLPTMIHMIGYSMGLQHSQQFIDIMSPFYDSNKLGLSINDINTFKTLFQHKKKQIEKSEKTVKIQNMFD